MNRRFAFLIFTLAALSGCTALPPNIRDAPAGDLQYTEARQDVKIHENVPVRWGGSIIEVENEENSTWVQILHYPLGSYGRPDLSSSSAGRFVMRTEQFLDPAIYAQGLPITVFGYLNGEAERAVGNKTIKLPIVEGHQFHLWMEYQNYDRYYYPSPIFYDYYPYSPYHHLGIRHHHHFH